MDLYSPNFLKKFPIFFQKKAYFLIFWEMETFASNFKKFLEMELPSLKY